MSAPDYNTDPVSITRRFELDAGHRLSEHDFKCQNFHGHRYKFEVEIGGYPDSDLGYVIDFSNVKAPIMDAFDHDFILNSNDPLLESGAIDAIREIQEHDFYLLDAEPTAENIALEAIHLIWSSMRPQERRNVIEVVLHLWETPNCDVTRRITSSWSEESYEVVQP